MGDNSSYQRRRLLLIATIVFALAMLTSRMALEPSFLGLLFLIASGAGQVICPIYLSLRTCTMAVGGSALLATGLYPFGGVLRDCCLIGLGFFTRGFFISALIYLNEIGGDSFRSWAMLVIFGLWPVSALFNSLDGRLGLERWTEYYLCVFLPCLVGTYYILEGWHPSPHYLYFKSNFGLFRAVR